MKHLMTCIVILITVMLLSCGNKTGNAAENIQLQDIKSEEGTNSSEATSDTTAITVNAANPIDPGQPAPDIDWDKKIIKTANVILEVKDFKGYNNGIHNSIKRFGAFIANEEQNEMDTKIQNVVSIKVPVAAFDDLINVLQPEGVKVHEKKISADDVTGEVVDTKARIEAKKQVRDRYMSLLKQAKNMKEVLQVQTEINGIQQEIESGTGRVKYLSSQAAYSTINLTYFQYFESRINNDNAPVSFAVKLKEAFKTGASFLSGLLIVVATIWPVFLVVFILWFASKKWGQKSINLVKNEK